MTDHDRVVSDVRKLASCQPRCLITELAEDVAELVLFLASDRSRHISGTPIWINGAQSLLV